MLKQKIKCPKCGHKIDGLIEDRVQRAFYDVFPEGDDISYQLSEFDDIISSRFYCPDCDKQIAGSEEEVEELFRDWVTARKDVVHPKAVYLPKDSN